MTGRLLGRLTGLAAFLLAACESAAPTTIVHYKRVNLVDSVLSYTDSRGPVLTIVHGTPFPGRQGETEAAVTSGFARTVTWRRTAFTARREETSHPENRVIMAFNAPGSTDAQALCRGAQPTPTASDRISVQAALCAGSYVVSDVTGIVANTTAPTDAAFASLVSQVARDLLDPNIRRRGGSDNSNP